MNDVLDSNLWISLHLRAAAFLLLITSLAWVFRKRSPFLESTIWRTGLLTLLSFPLLTGLIPAVPVWKTEAGVQHRFLAPTLQESFTTETLRPHEAAPEDGRTAQLQSFDDPPIASPQPDHQFSATSTSRSVRRPLPWGPIAATLWLTGTCLFLIRLFFSFRHCRQLERGAAPLSAPLWRAQLSGLQTRMNCRRQVRLLRHPELTSPAAWGISHARIALPLTADTWDAEARTCVLCHELSHVVRRDALFRLGGELCRALFWYNPLIWVALKRFHLAEERAADHTVLALGAHPARYADLLVRFGTHTSLADRLMPASAMATSSTIRLRLEAVLRPEADFRLPRRASLTPVMALTGVAGLVMGGLAFSQGTDHGASLSATPPPRSIPQSDEPTSILVRIYELPAKLAADLLASESRNNSSGIDRVHDLMRSRPQAVQMLAAAALPKNQAWAHRTGMRQKGEDKNQILTFSGSYHDEEGLMRLHLDSGVWFGAETITTELHPHSPRLVQTLMGRNGKIWIFAEWY